MTFNIKHAESLSRGELLLRSFFGLFYIYLPHGFVLLFMGLWGAILGFIAWWMILFTGRYPQSFFEYQVGLQRWQMRVNARYFNLTDGYPAFGIDSKDEVITFEVPYPEKLSRGMLLVRAFFGWLCSCRLRPRNSSMARWRSGRWSPLRKASLKPAG